MLSSTTGLPKRKRSVNGNNHNDDVSKPINKNKKLRSSDESNEEASPILRKRNSRRRISKIQSDSEDSFDFSDEETASNNSHSIIGASSDKIEVEHSNVPEDHDHAELDLDGWASLLDGQSMVDDQQIQKTLGRSGVSSATSSSIGSSTSVSSTSSADFKLSGTFPLRYDSGLVFQIDLPTKDSCFIELIQKLSIIPSLFIGTSSLPLEGRYVPQSVRNFLLNSNISEQFKFELLETSSPKAFDLFRTLAHSLTGIVCKTSRDSSERLFLFPLKEGKGVLIAGVIYKWELIEKSAVEIYLESLEVKRKMHLVLDLDSTLIWALPATTIDEYAKQKCFNISNNIYNMFVQFRPGVARFLHEASSMFEISIYTAAELEYARELIRKANLLGWKVDGSSSPSESQGQVDWNEIIPISRIVSSAKEASPIPNMKDLQNSFLFYQYHRMRNSTIIIDDNVGSWIDENRVHVYVIRQFTGDDGDRELAPCLEYLKSVYREFFTIRNLPQVRL